jgi:hypothetical protein
VVLPRHHLGGTSGTLRDPRAVPCRDDVVLVQRFGFVDGAADTRFRKFSSK